MGEQRMLRFVTVERDMPAKRGAEERREDFGEIYRAVRGGEGGGAGGAVLAVRGAVSARRIARCTTISRTG